jgi:Flp pilus assembly protein TadD
MTSAGRSRTKTDQNFETALRLQQQGLADQAAKIYAAILKLHPKHFGALNYLGVLNYERGDYANALRLVGRAVAASPDYAEAHYHRGLVLQAMGRIAEAVASYDRAIAIKPGYARAFYNRGVALEDLPQVEQAFASYERAIAHDPRFAEAYNNRGLLLQGLKRIDAAIADYDRSIALRPDLVDGYWNKANALLLKGDLPRGWDLYEVRWRRSDLAPFARDFAQPRWSGEAPLVGKTVLIHAEQGFGDSLQFCRYAPLVAQLGAVVSLEVPAALAPVMKSLSGPSRIVVRGEPATPFDLHCPMMSLPLAFRTDLTTIPASARYLSADRQSVAGWERRLGERRAPRVGLAWSGRREHRNDHNRSLALSLLTAHLPAGFEYFSLQKEVRDSDQRALGFFEGGRHFGEGLAHFGDTAALCELVDLVISVDTSVAHLSAALGRPTWLLLPFSPDWRWLLGRSDSPWYPTARLYRQAAPGEWAGALERVAADLLAWRDAP